LQLNKKYQGRILIGLITETIFRDNMMKYFSGTYVCCWICIWDLAQSSIEDLCKAWLKG